MPADGYLNFDTKVDSDGFEKGVKNIEYSVKGFGKGIASIASIVGKAFAAMGIAAVGKQAIESAADVKAAESQFSQTFGDMASSAEAAISRIAEPADILDSRLKSAATSMYAFAKTAKMETSTAINFMEEALSVAADSAAYYDRSLEQTTETLQSFLKGNYANDAALGLSATEYTRNAKAMELYGKKFIDLTEAQKQLTLLEMVKDANKLSGAMGQAAREAGGWENVTGNLSEAWNQLLAAVGKPMLKLAVPVVQNLTTALVNLTSWANYAYSALAKVFGWQEDQTAATNAATDAQNELTTAVEETGKAKKALAGFDEIEILSSSGESASAGPANEAAEGLEQISNADFDIPEEKFAGIEKMISVFEKLTGLDIASLTADARELASIMTEQYKEIDWTGIETGAKKIADAFIKLNTVPFETLSPHLKDLTQITGYMAEYNINSFVPELLDGIGTGLEFIATVSGGAIDLLIQLYKDFLVPIGEFIAPYVVDFLSSFNKQIEDLNGILNENETFKDLMTILGVIYDYLVLALAPLTTISLFIADLTIDYAWTDIKLLLEQIADAIGLIAAVINGDFDDAWEHLKDLLWDNAVDAFKERVDSTKESFEKFGKLVSDTVSLISETFTEMGTDWRQKISSWWEDDVKPWFTIEKWKEMLSGMGTALAEAVVGVGGFVETWKTNIAAWWEDDVKPWFTAEKWKETLANITTFIDDFFNAEDGFVHTWKRNIEAWWTDSVKPWFSLEKWIELGTNIKDGFLEGLNGVLGGVGTLINDLIDKFQGLANGTIELLNSMIDGWNKVADVSPGLKSINRIPQIDLSGYKIPEVAKGTVTPTRVNMPLMDVGATTSSWVNSQSGTSRIGGSTKTEVILQLDRRELGRAVVDVGDEEHQIRGTSLVVS